MSIRISFACGHHQDWKEGDSPVCQQCGDRQVVRSTAPPPRFTGSVSTPLKGSVNG